MSQAHPAPKMSINPEHPAENRFSRLLRATFAAKRMQYAPGVANQTAGSRLLADAKLLNNDLVTFGVGFSKVVEQATTLAHHHEKTAPGGVILLMTLKVFRQFTNPLAKDGDLHFRRTSVGRVRAVLVNQGGFFLSG
jgi:hypothetical protein